MGAEYFVTLKKITEKLHVEKVFYPDEADNIRISSADINRPGLQLVGFFDYFDQTRIQILGLVEETYLKTLTSEQKSASFTKLFATGIPAIIMTRGLEVSDEMMAAARQYNIPVLRSNESTSIFMTSLNAFLDKELAQRITRHGVLVEVFGEGVLIMGDSGIGKSETAIELVKRGHLLIADDAVEIKKVFSDTLMGSSPEIIRHYIELRGIGIVNVRRLFGMESVKEEQKIDLIIILENWDEEKRYDRLGMETHYTELLGVKIASLEIPVRPGRNLSMIIEVAAMNNRQKRLGYNAAQELNERLLEQMQKGDS